MKTYYFYDSDWNYGGKGDMKYHIQGEEFRKLLEVCSRYSTHVSFVFCPECEEQFRQLLSPFEAAIPTTTCQKKYLTKRHSTDGRELYMFSGRNFTERFYNTSPELTDVLCSLSDSIFTYLDGWGYCNPEDPTFYRADGSIFFSSTIHEGECKLTPRDDEDVSEIIKNPLWVSYED